VAYYEKRQGKVKRIGPLVVGTVTPIFQKYGFVQARILLEWEHIMTPKFAKLCEPVKVAFPYKQRNNGCLYLRSTSSMATEITYLEPQILEKINQYFGYQAIGKISIHHGPLQRVRVEKRPKEHELSEETKTSLDAQVESIENDRLRDVLLSLGKGIHLKKR
jgi:hypothetical protein